MHIITYFPLLILLYFSLKFLLKFIDENIVSLKEQIKLQSIESGILSIKDIQKDNYERFIKIIKLYLSTHNYENIIFEENSSPELTNITAILNNESVYISCLQNNMTENPIDDNDFTLTTKEDVQMFLGRMLQNNCKKGLLINNTTYSESAKEFVKVSSKNIDLEIKLVDGYELTKAARLYKNYIISKEAKNEFR